MQRHGIGRQVQRTSSGSTPHEPVTIPQISSSRSPASDRPRQSTLGYPALVSNRPTIHHVRRDPPPIHHPLHRRPTCRGRSIPITNLSRGSQIAIAPAAWPSFPQARFPPLEAFGRRPRARGPTVMGPASETLHNRRRASDPQLTEAAWASMTSQIDRAPMGMKHCKRPPAITLRSTHNSPPLCPR